NKLLSEEKSKWTTNIDKSIELSNQALMKAKTIKDKQLISDAYQSLGNSYSYKNDFSKSLEFYNKAVNLRKNFTDKRPLARTYNRLGIIYKNQSNFERSLHYHLLALDIRKNIDDELLIATSLNNIGSTYYKMRNYKNALFHYLEALSLRKKHKIDVTDSYRNIGLVYSKLDDFKNALNYYNIALSLTKKSDRKSYLHTLIGNLYLQEKLYKKSVIQYKKALKIREFSKATLEIAASYQNLGIVFKRTKQYNKALKYHSLALDIRTEENNKILEALSIYQIAEVYFAKQDYQKSIKNHIFANKIYNSIDDIDGILKTLLGLSKSYDRLNNYKETKLYLEQLIHEANKVKSYFFLNLAYEMMTELEKRNTHYKKALIYQNKLIENIAILDEITDNKIILELKTKFQSDEKVKENQLLKKEAKIREFNNIKMKFLRNLLILILLIISIFVIILILQNRQKQKINTLLNDKNKLIEKQKKELEDNLQNLKEKQDTILKLENHNTLMAMAITAN
ncbi:MAG: tetratricopeptide repeat protein, partial [Candidatus Cloacimonadota bacterium]|nr:tetratricopeptide repeat protein [Candidatus Cloacimonadota bacterium]